MNLRPSADDKRKLIDDAVAELKNAAGDGKVTSEKGQEEGDGRRQGQARGVEAGPEGGEKAREERGEHWTTQRSRNH